MSSQRHGNYHMPLLPCVNEVIGWDDPSGLAAEVGLHELVELLPAQVAFDRCVGGEPADAAATDGESAEVHVVGTDLKSRVLVQNLRHGQFAMHSVLRHDGLSF